jgi:FAD/FMN-containing dehydrogenase
MLIGARLVTAAGEIINKHIEQEPGFLQALQVSLGSLGILTQLRLKLLPAFKLHRRELFTPIDLCLQHLDELVAQNRNFDFYWYPRNDMAKIRIMNPPGQGLQDFPYARLDRELEGWSNEVLPRQRQLRFDETEFAVPAEAGPDCFKEVRQRIKQKHRRQVAWRVLYRTIAADDAWLSPCFGRDTVTISLHHNAGLPYQEYFQDLEPVFRSYNGRPHWGKKHSLTGQDLYALYPQLPRFLEIRKQLDPEGLFLNPYLKQLLGVG